MRECFTLLFPIAIKMQFPAEKKTATGFCSRVLNGKVFDSSCFIYSLF